MTNLDSVLKSRDITLPTKVCTSQNYDVFSSHVQMWELYHKEGWEPKNWWFQTVVLEKTFESPLDSEGIQPAHPKEINPKYSLEGLMVNWSSNTLATWCEETTTWKRPWCDGERLRAGEGDDRGWDGWMASLTQWTWVWGNSKRRWGTGKPGVLQSKGLQRVRHNLVTEQQQISNNNNYPKSSHEQIGNFFNSKGLSFLDFMLGDNML